MKKLLIALCALTSVSFASSLDMSTLACRDTKLNASTTLKNVQDNCLIKKQTSNDGRYEVKFVNDGTPKKKTVTCYFANNTPTALLNSCK